MLYSKQPAQACFQHPNDANASSRHFNSVDGGKKYYRGGGGKVYHLGIRLLPLHGGYPFKRGIFGFGQNTIMRNLGTGFTLREKLIKIGAKVVRHAKYVTFQMAEVAILRDLFAAILDKIAQLRLLPGTG